LFLQNVGNLKGDTDTVLEGDGLKLGCGGKHAVNGRSA
jgi:hypothetical protein